MAALRSLATCVAITATAFLMAAPVSAQDLTDAVGPFPQCTDDLTAAYDAIFTKCSACPDNCPEDCCIFMIQDTTMMCEIGGCCIRSIGGAASGQAGLKVHDSGGLPDGAPGGGGQCDVTLVSPKTTCPRCALAIQDDGTPLDCEEVLVGSPMEPFTQAVCAEKTDDATADTDPETGATITGEPETDDDDSPTAGTGTTTTTDDEETPEPSDDDDDDNVCFPASATVELEGGDIITMDELSIGDRVHVGNGEYSTVFMFTHRDAASANARDYVRITTKSGAELVLSRGHYIYVNGGVMRAARAVQVDDRVELGNGQHDTVTAVDRNGVRGAKGLYNPHTVHGDIVVDGIKASTYTTAVEPTIAHAGLGVLRKLCAMVGIAGGSLDKGADLIANRLPSGAPQC